HDAGATRTATVELEGLVADARRVGYAPVLAEALVLLGEIEDVDGDNAGSYQALKEATWQAEASRADELKAEAAVYLVNTAARLARFDEANDWERTADAILRRIGGHERLRAWLELHTGISLTEQGRSLEALPHLERSTALKAQAGASRGQLARNLNDRAVALDNLGRYEEALRDVERAIDDLGEELGKDHPMVGTLVSNEGETLDHLGRHATARAAYTRALAIEARAYGPESTNIAFPLTGLGQSFLADHRPDEARAALERAAGIRRAHEADATLVAETDFALARALRAANVERARAEALAAGAEKTYAARPAFAAKAREVAAWLAAERRGPASAR
ncbi:MAG TPA: tetratricopeptide repeat protein, partial [Polyangia bacterium]|nr:tetratricopeptide repeat protein [Polyangia bacterium]